MIVLRKGDSAKRVITMKDFLLICAVSATFLFGFYLMKQLDIYLVSDTLQENSDSLEETQDKNMERIPQRDDSQKNDNTPKDDNSDNTRNVLK